MKKLNAVIVDDEPDNGVLLQLQLERHCSSVETVTTFTNPVDALRHIPTLSPDVLFVDVEMPFLNGFQLLEQLLPLRFNVIFVTAFNQYAIRAFKFNALDYLLKPADAAELQQALLKAGSQPQPDRSQIVFAGEQFKGKQVSRIAIPSQNGISFIQLADIVYAEASDSYSKVFLVDGTVHVISKTLKDVQALLEGTHFQRVHRQYLVNLNFVRHFSRNNGILTMDNRVKLPIARSQYDSFMEKYYSI